MVMGVVTGAAMGVVMDVVRVQLKNKHLMK